MIAIAVSAGARRDDSLSRVLEHVTVRRSSSTDATECSASSSLAGCPAEPRAGHPSTARPSRDCLRSRGLSSAPPTRDLIQVNGPRACGAYWHTRAAGATMTGWPVMTARPRRGCGWPLCPFWTGPGPRGRADGCPLSLPSLPRPPPGPGTGPLAAGSGPWPSGQALLASGWWRGALARKRQPGPRCWRTSRPWPGWKGSEGICCSSLPQRPRLPPGRNTRSPPAIAVLPPVGTCFPGSVDGHRRAVAPAPPAAADGARDRRGSPERRVERPAGRPGRAAPQAEDGRRLSSDRSRICSPAAGSIG